jgi:hypothetical protein
MMAPYAVYTIRPLLSTTLTNNAPLRFFRIAAEIAVASEPNEPAVVQDSNGDFDLNCALYIIFYSEGNAS